MLDIIAIVWLILVHIAIMFSDYIRNLDSRCPFVAASQKEHSALARISSEN